MKYWGEDKDLITGEASFGTCHDSSNISIMGIDIWPILSILFLDMVSVNNNNLVNCTVLIFWDDLVKIVWLIFLICGKTNVSLLPTQ